MLRQRILSILVLFPIGMALVFLGGWPFNLFIVLIVTTAGWEYVRMFRRGDFRPAALIVIGGAGLLVVLRAIYGFAYSDLAFSALVMLAMFWHVIERQRGQNHSAASFAITVSGVLYLGWLGAYLISLRAMDNGLFWFLLILPATWLADAGAYFVGHAFGRHKMASRVSPGKTWEGYLGGVVTGAIGGGLLALLWGQWVPDMQFWQGFWIGFILSVVTPAGDLGESMLKRDFGLKDSSQIIPGHGGVMDRIDSWLWAATIGYYLIVLLY